MQDDSWALRAACRGVNVELFYATVEPEVRRALSYCQRCEVRPACLEAAMDRGEAFGTWGGVVEADRRRVLRRERRDRRAA